MNPPASCKQWASLAKNASHTRDPISPDHRHALGNFLDDNCVDTAIESKFFDSIAAAGTPANEQQAYSFAVDTVLNEIESFTCKGVEVPNTRFGELLVVEKGTTLVRYRFAKMETHEQDQIRQTLRQQGINLDLANVTLAQAGYVADVIQKTCPVPFGGRINVVWATEANLARRYLSDIIDLVDRLGLGWYQSDEDFITVWEYLRSDLPAVQLHAPRVLDADGYPYFKPNNTCSDCYGMTKPADQTRPDTDGLPEAVHPACRVNAIRVTVIPTP